MIFEWLEKICHLTPVRWRFPNRCTMCHLTPIRWRLASQVDKVSRDTCHVTMYPVVVHTSVRLATCGILIWFRLVSYRCDMCQVTSCSRDVLCVVWHLSHDNYYIQKLYTRWQRSPSAPLRLLLSHSAMVWYRMVDEEENNAVITIC